MDSGSIRRKFLEFFEKKGHQIVPSAPLVLKNDPTLLFTNSGMVQFKDYFLGNEKAPYSRIADTQKCLRVSGKHNDLEEVGIDTYHHTMFEMLGNWSFGDYFKHDAIDWAWELLTEVYQLPKERLYVTVFGGDTGDKLPMDTEAADLWKKHIAPERILSGNKKDNFWEMGETGPCGPCSEIHIDLRSDAEIAKVPGKDMVNTSHPQVIEIWNLVFMEFNRKADGSLEKLPAQHVDTGMGFERLCMAIQGKTSNYDTDVFTPLIDFISKASGVQYTATQPGLDGSRTEQEKTDIAMRVMADHIRAVSFAICDGQLPSNTGAGYVIRRILRRAVRYGFTFLNFKEPFLYKLVPVLSAQLKDVFKELESQKDYVAKVIMEEEVSFLRTLEKGIEMINEEIDWRTVSLENLHNELLGEIGNRSELFTTVHKDFKYTYNKAAFRIGTLATSKSNVFGGHDMKQMEALIDGIKDFDSAIERIKQSISVVPGEIVFRLYDTFGFPVDLTSLIAREKGLSIDEKGFETEMLKQKERSKAAAAKETGDWMVVGDEQKTLFTGYTHLEDEVKIIKYRAIKQKGKDSYQLVFNKTPFYAESGGQVGDTGYIQSVNEKIYITDTKKENELIVHFADQLPESLHHTFTAVVNKEKRQQTQCNHSATHLLHAALRQVLGKHVEQKGSLVNHQVLRFDFSHFAAMTNEELKQVEKMVNEKIRTNIALDEKQNVPIAEAKALGAMALFGEKYGEFVRVITFDRNYSVELCGGTHVPATGQIGFFKIVSESSVAAGVRRIEAITAAAAENSIAETLEQVEEVKAILKNPKHLVNAVKSLAEERAALEKKIEALYQEKANLMKDSLALRVKEEKGLQVLIEKIEAPTADAVKNIAYGLRNQFENLLLILAVNIDGKPQVCVMVGEKLAAQNKFHAGNMVKELAKEIDGGGGGQPFFATAGGKNLNGLDQVIVKAKQMVASA
ncbi:MAG: alanine--tRNA ligase [Flammeovirgaceae bacterium]|nr:alanine--tRNA ligase [Flammeovirgaceae bacterium]